MAQRLSRSCTLRGDKAGAALADEQRGGLVAHQRMSRCGSQAAMAASACLPNRHDAGFAALAGDLRLAGLQVEVVEIESAQFGQAQAGRIKQLEHGAVACLQGIVAGCSGEPPSSSWVQTSGDSTCGKALAALGGRRPMQGLLA